MLKMLFVAVSLGLLVVVADAADDATPLENVVTQLAADVNRLQAQLTAAQAAIAADNHHSAFMAQFSAATFVGPASGPFRFDHVLFNDGGNYDPGQGVFTAPYAGVYLFNIKFITAEQDSRQALDLIVNFNIVDRLTYDNLAGQTGHGGDARAFSTTLRLHPGDRVWLQPVLGYTGGTFYGGFHSTFSGSLLYAD